MSWRSSNIDEMVRVAFAEKGSPLLKEGHWRVPSVVAFAVVRCGLCSTGDAPRPDAVVRVAVDDDGVVPGCPGGGAVVRVVADDDGVVHGRPGGGAVVGVAVDHDGTVPRRPGEGTTVADVVLDVVDDGAFEDPTER